MLGYLSFPVLSNVGNALIVGEAPPQSPIEASAYLMALALQLGNNQRTGYTTVGITKLLPSFTIPYKEIHMS